MYGWQWRHFGAEYKDMHTDYTGKGVDQIAQVRAAAHYQRAEAAGGRRMHMKLSRL